MSAHKRESLTDPADLIQLNLDRNTSISKKHVNFQQHKEDISLKQEILERDQRRQNQEISYFRIFTFLNVFIMISLGIGCLTIYPKLGVMCHETYILILVYMCIEIICGIVSLVLLFLIWIVGKIIKKNQWCNIGLYPVLYQLFEHLAYGIYIPLCLNQLLYHRDSIPSIALIDLIYVLCVSLLYLGRTTINLFSSNFISPHIINYEDSAVYEVNIEEIKKYKQEVLQTRNEWIKQQQQADKHSIMSSDMIESQQQQQ